MKKQVRLIAVLTVASLSCHAGILIQAQTATASIPNFSSFTTSALINQSGLSSTYTSGVTNSGTYFASAPTHDGVLASNVWAGAVGMTSAQVTFDLGASYTLQSVALWNRGVLGPSALGIKDFEILFSNDPTFSTATNMGSFTASALGTGTATLAEIFNVTPTDARYVRLNILNILGGNLITFGEVAFVQQSNEVPEPSSIALGLLGLAAVAVLRRR